jgi:universal stress protein A
MASHDIHVNRILCAVTFSPSTRGVIEWAARLAEAYGAELRLFHVQSSGEPLGAEPLERDTQRVLSRMSTLAGQLRGGVRISAAVTDGDAATEILRHARLVQADLIAIGMRARDGTVSPLIRQIAIAAPCPVLAVQGFGELPPAHHGGSLAGEVLCAVNFLPASLAAADYAFALGRTTAARVTVVHILPEHWDGPERHDANITEARMLLEHHFRQLLQIAVSDVSVSGRDASEIVTSGRPCIEIVRIARNRKADLMVMGIDAEHASSEEFGETTACVMQFAQCAVLLVPQRPFLTPRTRGRSRSGDRPH